MAAPTFVGIESLANGAGGGNGTSAVFSWDGITGEADDDIGLMLIYKESTAAYTATPSGWNQLGPWDQDTGGFKFRTDIWWRRRAGDTGTATWSWSGSTWRDYDNLVHRNGITSETPVIGVTADEETAQNTAPTHPGITIARSNSGLVWAVFNFSNINNTTAPTGFAFRSDSLAAARNVLSYDDLTTSPGASGTVSATLSGDIEYPLTVLMELVTEAAAGKAPPPSPIRRLLPLLAR